MRSQAHRSSPIRGFVCALLFLTVLFATAMAQQKERPAAITPDRPDPENRAEKEPSAKMPDALVQLNGAFVSLAEKVSQGVVQVLVTSYGPLEENHSAETALIARQRAIGSGVIVDPSGYVMTNAHVVEGARRIRVVLPLPPNENALLEPEGKRRILEAKVVGTHQESDLALLKVSAQGLSALSLANPRMLRQGQLVFAVGSPIGLQDSITMGVISSVARQPDPNKPMVYIQTDAAINPGNSGGPLVDVEGNVVGINTFILSGSGGNEGIGFAVPVRVVRFVYDSLRKYGHVHRSEIEVSAQTVTPSLAAGLGLKRSWGVVISDVKPGGPAEAAGLKIGDVILKADERPIDTVPAFTAALYLHPVDQVMKLEVLRAGAEKTINVAVLQERNHMDQMLDAANPESNLVAPLGILAIGIDEHIREAVTGLRVASGVIVLGRAADLLGPDIGLVTGDVIHAINNRPVDTVDNLRSAMSQLKSGDSVVLQVERGGKLQFVSFELD
jgi:serine protease Do